MNKYEKWYEQIIENAKRPRECYTESHHITPKSVGGTDDPENLVNLTAREHFVCHWLLTKIHVDGEEHWKMLNALRIMKAENKNQQRYDTPITSRVYENLKVEYSKIQSERTKGENNPMFGDKFFRSEEGRLKHKEAISGERNAMKSQQMRDKMREIKTGKKRAPFSDEWLAKLTESNRGENNGMYGKKHSEDTLQKIREKAKLRTYSEETNEKRRRANLGRTKPKKLCPHCNQLVAVNGYARWHGDNCKHK
jgi:NUMOD3 motif